ncbi:MAG: hypothetical protein DMG22_09575 [Acidobacteria bacterium]|nr:MAG: hypothetical protein DMG22_09575 [Acidobacteriota bacterium]
MPDRDRKRFLGLTFLAGVMLAALHPSPAHSQGAPPGRGAASTRWQTKARLRGSWRSTPGALFIGEQGVEFQPPRGSRLHWFIVDIKSVVLPTPRRFTLVSYENRRWKHPGDRQFRFELNEPLPPGAAEELVARVGKPAINGDPDPKASSFADIPARHRTRSGGSSGVLRLREEGIDYVDAGGRDSRSWRWADIQTIANPDPYDFRVGAYLETFDLKLKQPMTAEIFDRLWDRVYGRGLNLGQTDGGEHHAER